MVPGVSGWISFFPIGIISYGRGGYDTIYKYNYLGYNMYSQ